MIPMSIHRTRWQSLPRAFWPWGSSSSLSWGVRWQVGIAVVPVRLKEVGGGDSVEGLPSLAVEGLRVCQGVVGSGVSPGSGRCGRSEGSGDVVPDCEADGHFGSVVGAVSRYRLGRKWGEMPLYADRNRWAPPTLWKPFMARSRCRVGWWLFSARLLRYFDCRCSTE